MKKTLFKLVLAFIIAGLVMSYSDLQASGGKTTVRVYIRVSNDWLSYGHIKVKKVTLRWSSSDRGMHTIFTGTGANFNTDDFEAGFVRYSYTSATFYRGRYRDFGISGSAGYPMECKIEFDVITYDSNRQAVVKSCCHTKSATISSGTSFVFEWQNKI
jgi:hypothetical protein